MRFAPQWRRPADREIHAIMNIGMATSSISPEAVAAIRRARIGVAILAFARIRLRIAIARDIDTRYDTLAVSVALGPGQADIAPDATHPCAGRRAAGDRNGQPQQYNKSPAAAHQPWRHRASIRSSFQTDPTMDLFSWIHH